MKPISRVQTKGLPARMLRNLAENQNELVDRVNYLTGAEAALSKVVNALSKKIKSLSEQKPKTKGVQR